MLSRALSQVAVLDVLLVEPFYLRCPDGRVDAGKARAKASASGGGKDEDDEEALKREDEDPGLRPMDARLGLPVKHLRGLLNTLRDRCGEGL